MRLKSISSFLATILLIGFTISTGIIVYYFVSTLPRTQTQQVSTQASKVLSCAGATFDVKVRNCNLLNGLVLWLRMDEGSGTIAYDYSGYGNNGTLYNGTNMCSNPPTSGCPTWVDGNLGKALSFDGVDDKLTIPDAPSLNPRNAITLVAWINQGTGGASFEIPVAKNFQYFIGGRHVSDGKASFGLFFSDGTSYYLRGSSVLPTTWLNKWHFLVGTYDGSVMKLYIDGVLDNSYSISKTIKTTSNNAFIGTWGSTDWFNGTIDEVRIYNRALTDDEIKELYYEGLTNKFNITIGLLNSGFADLGNSFTAIVYLKNGTILQLPLILDNNLSQGYYLEKTLTIDGYYPSYGLVDRIMVCSNDCQGVCSEIKINNQC